MLLHFDNSTTRNNLAGNVETEANLFALALLCDDDIDSRLALPLSRMNGYMLDRMMKANLQKK